MFKMFLKEGIAYLVLVGSIIGGIILIKKYEIDQVIGQAFDKILAIHPGIYLIGIILIIAGILYLETKSK